MSGKRLFVRPVSKDAKYQPAMRLEFAGKRQQVYFDLRKVAETDFDVKQATLCKMILEDWIKMYLLKKESGKSQGMIKSLLTQTEMALPISARVSSKLEEKKAKTASKEKA